MGKRFAESGRATVVLDVSQVLVPKVFHSRQHRVSRRLAEPAKRGLPHVVGQLPELVQVVHGPLAPGDPLQDVHHVHHADPAGRAGTAGLMGCELHVKLGQVDHAVGVVQDDQAP